MALVSAMIGSLRVRVTVSDDWPMSKVTVLTD